MAQSNYSMKESRSHVRIDQIRESAHENRDASAPQLDLYSLSPSSVSTRSRHVFSIMINRRNHPIYLNGEEVTPDDITCDDYAIMEDSFTHAAFETKKVDATQLKEPASTTGGMTMYETTIDLDNIYIDYTIETEVGYPLADYDAEKAPSAYNLPKDYPPISHPPKIFVNLKETETIYLFEVVCYSYEKGSEAGAVIEEENEYYAYITVGKGRNRKMVQTETQTKLSVSQTRHTGATRPIKKNAICFASLWDMYDTYEALANIEASDEEDEMVLFQTAAAHLLRKKRALIKIKRRPTKFEEIAELPQFYDAAMLHERVIAAKCFSNAQKVFRGLVSLNPLLPDLVYEYNLKLLWKFESPETAGRPVASIAFNPKNPDIIAVGHGRFNYAESMDGIVCIWCTKNPSTPERLYGFEFPVTAIGFSNNNPNWLAVGFANGDVLILDITSHTKKIVSMSRRESSPSFEPIWVTKWVNHQDSEYVVTTGQDGRISRFINTKTSEFLCTPMMRISAVEGQLKGLEVTKPCNKVDVPITRYPAALCLSWHPRINHLYLVGTDEGCIHKCSTHYLNQHMDVFRAHSGPIYFIEASPFLKPLMVTCGADGAIRLWYDGISEYLLTLHCPFAVYCTAFCPINSTILISVGGNVLSVWDLRRKVHKPSAEHWFPSGVNLTFVQFSKSGDNLFVADTSGRFYTFHLEDTPIPPYYQRRLLEDAINQALCMRPQIVKQMEKINNSYAKDVGY